MLLMAVWRLQVQEQKALENGKSTVKGVEDTGSSKAALTASCGGEAALEALLNQQSEVRG